MCKTLEKMEHLIERLENLAGGVLSKIQTSEGMCHTCGRVFALMTLCQDSPPDDVEAQVEDLEEAEDQKSILKGLELTTAAWMAISLRQKYLRQQETMVMDIESDLAVRPPLFVFIFITDANIVLCSPHSQVEMFAHSEF